MHHSVDHMTSYQSDLSCTIFEIFDVEEYRDLEINSPCELNARSVVFYTTRDYIFLSLIHSLLHIVSSGKKAMLRYTVVQDH